MCQEEYLVCGEGEEQGGAWMEKVIIIVFKHNNIRNLIDILLLDLFSNTA